jgi:hypothetical protein
LLIDAAQVFEDFIWGQIAGDCYQSSFLYLDDLYMQLGVSIIDPTRPEDKWVGYGFDFFDPNWIGSGSSQPDPTRLIIFFEVIL